MSVKRAFCLILALLCLAGCQPNPVDTVTPISIDGSTTLYELSNSWAQACMKKHPELKLEVRKSGTKKGIESFLAGNSDIVETSRRLTTEEIFRARRTGVQVEEFYAGFAIYTVAVNPRNPVNELTDEQVRQIFLGRITNWKEVGGNDVPIDVLYRSIGVDEYDYFLEKFVNIGGNLDLDNLPPHFSILPTPEDIVKKVAAEENAIGYYFLVTRIDGDKALRISKQGSADYRSPVLEDAITGAYPILRPYFMYKNRNSRKPLNIFIDFIYSDEGISITKDMHFVPVPVKGGHLDREVLFEYI